MAQFSVEIIRRPGSLLGGNQHAEVEKLTGLSRSTIYALMADGKFPRPVRLTAKAVAWPESKIREWLNARQEA
ncbi:AlpA family transcriptional regulator [Ruegeria sp. PrR005]|uniref:AlpA family transcriptional regulator n=2 Tax=Ruegeria sp. PrR005 TaxID=2706882 RepID=A0A6B2NTF1_9RHOB|nr:AlpA family transcriptional regulator [Ruegeria sp. PrR005]